VKHTELIQLILKELSKHGKNLHTLREIHETLLPDIAFTSAYSSNWSNWKNGKTANINNAKAKSGIAETLGFDSYIWDTDTHTQQTTIREAVQRFMHPAPKVDLSSLMPQNTPLSDEQTKTLLELRKADTTQAHSILDAHDFLKPLPENQIFLLKLLPLLFEKGMYGYLVEHIFPALLPHNAEHIHVKIFQAHTYGSLSQYLKAVSILSTIDTDSNALALEVKTGLLSNLRRYTLEKENLSKQELLDALPLFIQHYTNIFENIEKHHYYPGINLAYMLTLSTYVSPDDPIIASDEVETIYKDAQASISHDSHHDSSEIVYYAKMSNIEFRLLLGKGDAEVLLGNLLDLDEPLSAYIERTVRMMQFFVRMLEQFSEVDASDLLQRFQTVITVMEDFISQNG